MYPSEILIAAMLAIRLSDVNARTKIAWSDHLAQGPPEGLETGFEALEHLRKEELGRDLLAPLLALVGTDPEQFRLVAGHRQPAVDGGADLVEELARIGSPGRVRSDRYDNAGAALLALQKLVRDKLRRGYMKTAIE